VPGAVEAECIAKQNSQLLCALQQLLIHMRARQNDKRQPIVDFRSRESSCVIKAMTIGTPFRGSSESRVVFAFLLGAAQRRSFLPSCSNSAQAAEEPKSPRTVVFALPFALDQILHVIRSDSGFVQQAS
jgi:hypothetical protein